MSRLALLLAAASLAAPGVPEAGPPSKRDRPTPRPPDRLPRRGPREERPTGSLARPCPRCGAQPGEDCDPMTLGRHTFHLARTLETP